MSIEFKRKEHSDIVVHWTGRDIDKDDPEMHKSLPVNWRKHCLRPYERTSSIRDPKIIKRYLDRLRDILKFGLWMKADYSAGGVAKIPSCSVDDGRVCDTPNIARVCFSELKLSQSRQHAHEYGRLGLGFKRMFLFNRGGHPLFYVAPQRPHDSREVKPNWFSTLIDDKSGNVGTMVQQSFFKYMSETEDLNYKYYSESEWRIVFPFFGSGNDGLIKDEKIFNIVSKYLVNANPKIGNIDAEFEKYSNMENLFKIGKEKILFRRDDWVAYIEQSHKKGLKFLVPVDYWLAMIIYPCQTVKIAAENDGEIRNLLVATRSKRYNSDQLESIAKGEENGEGEKYNLPTEIDLDTIGNF